MLKASDYVIIKIEVDAETMCKGKEVSNYLFKDINEFTKFLLYNSIEAEKTKKRLNK